MNRAGILSVLAVSASWAFAQTPAPKPAPDADGRMPAMPHDHGAAGADEREARDDAAVRGQRDGLRHHARLRTRADPRQRHPDRVRKAGGFSEVLAINIQDDAIRPIPQANVTQLRKMIGDAKAAGRRVLVVPCVLASHGIQATLQQDLRSLDYTFQHKGMSESPKFTRWVLESLAAARKAPGAGAKS